MCTTKKLSAKLLIQEWQSKDFFEMPIKTPSESVNLSSFLFMLIDENFMRPRTEENISVGRETKIIRVNG